MGWDILSKGTHRTDRSVLLGSNSPHDTEQKARLTQPSRLPNLVGPGPAHIPMQTPLRLSLVAVAILAVTQAAQAQTFFPPVPTPPGNPNTPQKELLGKALFWDEQLSADRTMACGTCHIFGHGGTDPRSTNATHPGADGVFGGPDDIHGSPGVVRQDAFGNQLGDAIFGARPQSTKRRAPPVINAAYESVLFWDGRATDAFTDPATGLVSLPYSAALESQIAGPPVSDVEMSHIGRPWQAIATDIANLEPLALADQLPANLAAFVAGQTYTQLFDATYGPGGVTVERIIFAIAAYERTLIADQSPFDIFNAGLGTLTPQEIAGRSAFITLGCNFCHTDVVGIDPTPSNSFPSMFQLGLRRASEDSGRMAITGNAWDDASFKTPGLRNVGLRAPYFHNGSAPDLTSVMVTYSQGGGGFTPVDPAVTGLAVSIGGMGPLVIPNLVAFMNSLTDPRVQLGQPPFDRPHLWSESTRVPLLYGVGTAGSGGLIPEAVGATPAYLGNSKFSIGLDKALAGTLAMFVLDFAPAPVPFQALGQNVYIGLTPASTTFIPGFTIAKNSGDGYQSLRLPIPNDAFLAGAPIYGQWLVFDPNGPFGFASSGAFTTTLF